jgi:hypothetical protein
LQELAGTGPQYSADVTANKQRHKSRVGEKKTVVLIAQRMCLVQ